LRLKTFEYLRWTLPYRSSEFTESWVVSCTDCAKTKWNCHQHPDVHTILHFSFLFSVLQLPRWRNTTFEASPVNICTTSSFTPRIWFSQGTQSLNLSNDSTLCSLWSKVQFPLEQATKAQMGSRSIAVLFL
jgi:hypothetical protein